jgi:dolichol-phosphate mannosyltransferase
MVPWLGFSDAIVYYDEGPRVSGDASYTWRKSFRLAKYALFSFSRLPLDAISLAGVIFSALALVYLAYVVLIALSGRAVAGWSSVIAVVLIVSAVQFLSVSILAQYLGMVFEQTKARPLYVLKLERLGTSPVTPQSR